MTPAADRKLELPEDLERYYHGQAFFEQIDMAEYAYRIVTREDGQIVSDVKGAKRGV